MFVVKERAVASTTAAPQMMLAGSLLSAGMVPAADAEGWATVQSAQQEAVVRAEGANSQ